MYKFKKIDGDKFTLLYEKDNVKKQIEFTRTVKQANRLQSIDSEARFKVMAELTKQGYTMDNNPFVIEKKEGNKTIRDESNLNYLINQERENVAGQIIIEIIEDTFSMKLEDFVNEIGLDYHDQEQATKFIEEFTFILREGETKDTVKTPSPNN